VQNGDLDKAVKAMCSLAQEAADYMIRRKSTGADLYEYLPNADPDDDDGRPRGYVQAGLEGTAEYLRQLPEGTRGGWVIYLLEILEDARWEERTFEDMLIDIQDDLTTRLDAHHW